MVGQNAAEAVRIGGFCQPAGSLGHQTAHAASLFAQACHLQLVKQVHLQKIPAYRCQVIVEQIQKQGQVLFRQTAKRILPVRCVFTAEGKGIFVGQQEPGEIIVPQVALQPERIGEIHHPAEFMGKPVQQSGGRAAGGSFPQRLGQADQDAVLTGAKQHQPADDIVQVDQLLRKGWRLCRRRRPVWHTGPDSRSLPWARGRPILPGGGSAPRQTRSAGWSSRECRWQ